MSKIPVLAQLTADAIPKFIPALFVSRSKLTNTESLRSDSIALDKTGAGALFTNDALGKGVLEAEGTKDGDTVRVAVRDDVTVAEKVGEVVTVTVLEDEDVPVTVAVDVAVTVDVTVAVIVTLGVVVLDSVAVLVTVLDTVDDVVVVEVCVADGVDV
jgi:hypothetical protein